MVVPGWQSEGARFLIDAGRALTADLDLDAIAQRAASLAVPFLASLCVIDLVEDDDLRDAMVDLLVGRGYEVRPVGDGRQGLDLLRSWRPDLVVTDLFLPGLDGPGLRAAQLAAPELAAIPLIVISGSAHPHEEPDRLRPAAFVPKPFRAEALLAAVASCLPRRR